MTLEQCLLYNLPKISDPRGNLSFVQSMDHIPFPIKRIYYLYDIPYGADRGSHAHKDLQQLIIPISGSFSIHLDDGLSKKTFHLKDPSQGLYITSLIWRTLDDFSSNAVCLVLASEPYIEADYIRDYNEFIEFVR